MAALACIAYGVAAGLLALYLYEMTPVGAWVDRIMPRHHVEEPVLDDATMAELFDQVDWHGWDDVA